MQRKWAHQIKEISTIFCLIGFIFIMVVPSWLKPVRVHAGEKLTLLQDPTPSLPSPCAHLLGSCDYYLCRESFQSCGPRGYWLGFGNHYCEEFTLQVKPTLSQESQDWLDHVGRCLREKTEAFPLESVCKQIKNLALASHTSCYVQTGFCRIPFLDKVKVLHTIYREFADPRIFKVFLEISRSCGKSLFHPGDSPAFQDFDWSDLDSRIGN
jgi:hypothetical protein